MTSSQLRQEVLNKVDAQAQECKAYLKSWFRSRGFQPTADELDVLAWYAVAFILNNDTWRSRDEWDVVLNRLRKGGIEFLVQHEIGPQSGPYLVS